jgi:hypothetical protein
MTTDAPDPIATAAARYKRDDAKAKQSRRALTELVLEALRQPGSSPTDIARRAEWTPAYVRKLARDNDIDADPAYKARTETARARLLAAAAPEAGAKQEATPARPAPETWQGSPSRTAPERPPAYLHISPEVAALSENQARELAGQAEGPRRVWGKEIRKELSGTDPKWIKHAIVEAAVQAGHIDLPGIDATEEN